MGLDVDEVVLEGMVLGGGVEGSQTGDESMKDREEGYCCTVEPVVWWGDGEVGGGAGGQQIL